MMVTLFGMVTLVILSVLKARGLIEVTPLGMFTVALVPTYLTSVVPSIWKSLAGFACAYTGITAVAMRAAAKKMRILAVFVFIFLMFNTPCLVMY
jgi:hypothetical protein